jgi:hypothetical protein
MKSSVRAILYFLGITGLVAGAWAIFFPRVYYTDFPMIGQGWVAAFGRYNEHFIQDVGGAYLGFAFIFLFAAQTKRVAWGQAGAAGYLVWQVPHLITHIFVRASLPILGYIGTLLLLGIAMVLCVAVLRGTRQPAKT